MRIGLVIAALALAISVLFAQAPPLSPLNFRLQDQTAQGHPSEVWATLAQDGHRRNAGPTSLGPSLRIRWAKALRGFVSADLAQDAGYQRSNNLAIRNGQILLITGQAPYPPEWQKKLAIYSRFDLQTGLMIGSVTTPAVGQSSLWESTRTGVMDTDITGGLITHYWRADGTVYAVWGSDRWGSYAFDVLTGLAVPGAPSMISSGPNASGSFTQSADTPAFYARGGASTHDSFSNPLPYAANALGLIGNPMVVPADSLKMYAPTVMAGGMAYSLNVTAPHPVFLSDTGYGVRITATDASLMKRWTYTDAARGILPLGRDHAAGGLRPFCAGDDGRIYYVGYVVAGGVSDWTQGVRVVGVPTAGAGATRTADLEVPLNWNPFQDRPSPLTPNLAAEATTKLLPQIAQRGNTLVLFQPQQSLPVINTNAHVWLIDLPTKTIRTRIDFPAGYFTTNTQVAYDADRSLSKDTILGGAPRPGYFGELSPERAVSMVVSGDSAFVVEPSFVASALQLRIERIVLATGQRTTTALVPRDAAGLTVAPASTGPYVMMRDLAAIDGTLVALVDLDLSAQAVIVIDGQ